MNSSVETLEISNLKIEVKKRDVKSLRIGVLPPSGKIRVTAPLDYDKNLIEAVVIKKLNWIRKQQEILKGQERQSKREAVSGESYFLRGRKYKLFVINGPARGKLELKNNSRMELHISKDSTQESRLNVINSFYRKTLQKELDEIIPSLQTKLGITITSYRIRKMKNRWGSCDPVKKRITINIELIKKNPACLNYIVIHELVHLIEANHGERFVELMDRYMPNWRHARDLLNSAPLAHADWNY